VPIVLKSGSLNLLETLGPLQACNGIPAPFCIPTHTLNTKIYYSCKNANGLKGIRWNYGVSRCDQGVERNESRTASCSMDLCSSYSAQNEQFFTRTPFQLIPHKASLPRFPGSTGRRTVSSNMEYDAVHRYTSNRLHRVTFQETGIFIISSMKI